MPRKDWETEFAPNVEEYKNNSSLQKDITYVLLEKTERLLTGSAANSYMKLQMEIEFKWNSEGKWIIPTFLLKACFSVNFSCIWKRHLEENEGNFSLQVNMLDLSVQPGVSLCYTGVVLHIYYPANCREVTVLWKGDLGVFFWKTKTWGKTYVISSCSGLEPLW